VQCVISEELEVVVNDICADEVSGDKKQCPNFVILMIQVHRVHCPQIRNMKAKGMHSKSFYWLVLKKWYI
jgi:hypothetical protein